ncbi:MAG: hypothetical protein OXH46_01720 [Gemmatimonadetes bacterium]|nr:hypothetical protein [Gemmatimonadota bacterium]
MNDKLLLYYHATPPLLYGHIRLLASNSASHLSAPLVISQTFGPNETTVYGSVYNLLSKLAHLFDDVRQLGSDMEEKLTHNDIAVDTYTDADNRTVRQLPNDDLSAEIFRQYTASVEKNLLLIGVYSRTLFEIFPKLGQKKIPVYDYEKAMAGKVSLRDMSNLFLHHKYFFLDGEFITDISTDRRSLSRSFMGRRVRWREYVAAVTATVNAVTIRGLTKKLASIVASLSIRTRRENIIFLVQNMESLTSIMSEKIGDPRYRDMLSLLFDEQVEEIHREGLVEGRIPRKGTVRVTETVEFQRPHFQIHEVLAERSVQVSVRMRVLVEGVPVGGPELEERRIKVGYREFFRQIDETFGEDKLLNASE